jgi:6-phosphofructokinase 2
MTARIITLTPNPALDIACTADAVRPTIKIRTRDERYDPGGGGVNVSRVLHGLGAETLALMLAGDVTGKEVGELLDAEGVAWQAVQIAGRTRISYTVHAADGSEFRFVPPGPAVQPAEWQALLALLEQRQGNWVVASGSLPPGAPDDFYAQASDIAHRAGRKFALDSSGPALRQAVGHRVEVLKLSLDEMRFLTGHALPDDASIEAELTMLLRNGAARGIAVSLGADGAILATADGLRRRPAVKVEVRSAVGAGDTFLAGMVLAMSRGSDAATALRFATAAAAVAVSRYGTAQIDADSVRAMEATLR